MVNSHSVRAELCRRRSTRRMVAAVALVPLWLGGRALPSPAQTVDVTSPVIQGLSFRPTTIDVTGDRSRSRSRFI
jgi:hypothetical protein